MEISTSYNRSHTFINLFISENNKAIRLMRDNTVIMQGVIYEAVINKLLER